MKTEEPAQATSTTQPAYTTQWPTTPMAIDPALQQQTTAAQYYSAYTSHYPQTAYATHYQAYAPPITSGGSTAANATATSNAMDTSDINTLKDALGSAGVDLRAEEESLQRGQSDSTHQVYRSYDDRSRKQPPKPSFDTRILGATMRTIGTNHKISRISEESVSYLALSLRARLQDLVTAMIRAAHHRTDTTFDRPASFYEDNSPMWSIVIKSDVAKQLAALERVEREEETKIRKERKERADLQAAHAAALAAQANGASASMTGGGAAGGGGDGAGGVLGFDDQDSVGGSAKKKRKKDGPGVTARNMSEDARKKMSNAVATQAAGLGGRYAWMTAASSSSATPSKPKAPAAVAAAAAPPTTSGTATITTTATVSSTSTPTATSTAHASTAAAANTSATPSSWARPYISTTKKTAASSKDETLENDTRTLITMRDAMFVIENERGHGGGRGAARGWS